MKYARILNNIAQEVIDFDPAGRFHPDVAALFVSCPDAVTVGSTHGADGTWSIYIAPPPPAPTAPVSAPPVVTTMQFKLLFTAPERVAIRSSTDPVVKDFFDLVEDPRLTAVDLNLKSTQDALLYLVSLALITTTRKDEILTGVAK